MVIVMLRSGLRRCEDDYEEAEGGREEEGDEGEEMRGAGVVYVEK